MEKSQTDHIFFFCWLSSFFCILPSRGFLQGKQKKNHALPDMSYLSTAACVCLCIFSHRQVQFEAFSWFEWRFFFSYTSVTSFTFSYFLQIGTGSLAHTTPCGIFWRINMYWQASTHIPVNTNTQMHTYTYLCPLKTCDQPDPIPCNHLESPPPSPHPPHTHTHV